jgi:uncharacterized protein (TIGR03118 family)
MNLRKCFVLLAGLVCSFSLALSSAVAQTNSYKQTNLVSDTMGGAAHSDSKLINPWGIAFVPGQPFWVSDNNSGFTTLYDQNGGFQGAFTVAPPAGSSNPSTPTGIVAPPANVNFLVGGAASSFVFDTEDGTISGWTGGQSTLIAVDNSKTPSAALSAVYKGLAFLQNATGNFLLAANFRSGKVEVYDTNFHLTEVLGATAFNDPALPAVLMGSGSPGYAPFGIHTMTINGQRMVLVTYALQDAPMHDPLHIAGGGVVDLFNEDGSFARRVTADAHVNAPWGAVVPPPGFGLFAGKLLVGNFGDGTISVYDLTGGNFIDQMKDSTGAAIANASLWDMVFGGGGQSGDANTLYITAGLANEQHGLFAAITPNTTAVASGDFSIAATPPTQTISAGQTATFQVTVSGLSGFNSAITLGCSGQPVNSTCNFSQMSLSPASGGTATAMMTIATNSSPYMHGQITLGNRNGRTYAMLLPIPALALLALLLFGGARVERLAGRRWVHGLAGTLAFVIATACVLAAGGCGYNSSTAGNGTQRGMDTVVITGTSGQLSHSTSVMLTVQ